MRKPKNIDDLTKCVNRIRDKLFIFCVECDNWHQVAIRVKALVTISQSRDKKLDDLENVDFVCGDCGADIDYLLDIHHKQFLEDRVLRGSV